MTDLHELLHRAWALRVAAERSVASRRAVIGDASQQQHIASTWHLRRAAVKGSIDNLVHGHGSAEQALGALDICPIAMLGFKAAGTIGYPWLIEVATADPDGSFVDHVRALLQHPDRRAYLVRLGAYHRFQWKRSVYQNEVLDWQAKPVANDPAATWRRRPIKASQRYLADDIVDCLTAADTTFSAAPTRNRGEMHDWLREHGGRPMFWHAPALPVFGGEGR